MKSYRTFGYGQRRFLTGHHLNRERKDFLAVLDFGTEKKEVEKVYKKAIQNQETIIKHLFVL